MGLLQWGRGGQCPIGQQGRPSEWDLPPAEWQFSPSLRNVKHWWSTEQSATTNAGRDQKEHRNSKEPLPYCIHS